jgi:hypothetical protein
MASRKSERGQSTALVLSMLFVMILFVAVVIDVGQAVNRRIALQLVADAGAFTGATEMAVGLNQIAYWNKWIQTAWAPMTWASFGFNFSPSCDFTEGVVNTYKGIRATLGAVVGVINFGYMFRPYTEARRVSEYNISDLFPGELELGKFEFDEWNLSPEVGVITPQRNIIPLPTLGQGDSDRGLYNLKQVDDGTGPNGDLPSMADSQRSAGWVCIDTFGPIPYPSYQSFDFNVWYEKADEDVNYFVWLVTVQPTKALMFDSILGPNAIPQMRAVGVAKPVGGSVVEGESTYVAKMVPAARAMTLSYGSYGAVNDSSYSGSLSGSLRVVTH